MSSIQTFSAWLENTPLSLTIQTVNWIIPSVQTAHILAISMAMAAATLVDLRLLGVAMREQAAADVAQRFFPWIWRALIVLLFTGAILVIGEPGRSLQNPAFVLKMILLVIAMLLTAGLQRSLKTRPRFWELATGGRAAPGAAAVLSLALWISIIFAGRWIAYTGG